MTKKVALVDIDGCLIINGQLNMTLVNKLKQYDEIILFTQRSILMQYKNMQPYVTGLLETEDKLLTTFQVVEALQKELKKPVRVSSSLDQVFGFPLEYYEKKIKPYEEAYLNDDPNANAMMMREIDAVWEKSHPGEKRGPEISPGTFYPEGKINQYVLVHAYLKSQQKFAKTPFTVDYFDDSRENLAEILGDQHQEETKPSCKLVMGSEIINFDTYVRAYGQFSHMKPDQLAKKLEANDPGFMKQKLIADLLEMIPPSNLAQHKRLKMPFFKREKKDEPVLNKEERALLNVVDILERNARITELSREDFTILQQKKYKNIFPEGFFELTSPRPEGG